LSKTVDAERAAEAEYARSLRAEKVLRELLSVVLLKREGMASPVIASRLGRSERTVRNRYETVRQLLERIERKGAGGPRR